VTWFNASYCRAATIRVLSISFSLSISLPSGGVTLKRRCTYRPSVNYLIVNKLFSLSLSPRDLEH